MCDGSTRNCRRDEKEKDNCRKFLEIKNYSNFSNQPLIPLGNAGQVGRGALATVAEE